MSKVTSTTTVTKTQTIVEYVRCDLCGIKSNKGGYWTDRGSDVDQVTVERRHGYNHGPDGANIKSESFDICPRCFVTRLVPWLEDQGAKMCTEEHDL